MSRESDLNMAVVNFSTVRRAVVGLTVSFAVCLPTLDLFNIRLTALNLMSLPAVNQSTVNIPANGLFPVANISMPLVFLLTVSLSAANPAAVLLVDQFTVYLLAAYPPNVGQPTVALKL